MSHPIDEDTVMEDEKHHANADIPSAAGPDPSGTSGGFKPSAKLRARIKKLAHWRINPSSVYFWEGASESHGGHATVSKGQMSTWGVDMRDLVKRALGKNLDREARGDFLRERAWMREGEPDVAVKKMRLADDTDFERVLGLAIREAEFLAVLTHRNIAELEGFAEDVAESTIWLVFPWAEDGNLRAFVASKSWEIPRRISLINDVAQGLAYLHSRDPPICHGNLKSLNVLVYRDRGEDGYNNKVYARITDFGSARRISQPDPKINTQAESQAPPVHSPSVTFDTSTKTIILTGHKYTLRWAAPELLLEDQLSLWSDIWALGWIAYEVMTESLPFEDVTSDISVVERVVEGKLPSLANDANLALIHELCSFMEMCWKIQPIERPTAESCGRAINNMMIWRAYRRRDQKDLNTITNALGDPVELDRLRNKHNMAMKALSEAWKIEGERRITEALYSLADMHRLSSEYDQAITLYSDALKISTDLGHRKVQADTLWGLASSHRLRSEYTKAIPLYFDALEIFNELGDKEGQADALWGLADARRLRNEYNKAIPLYSDALKLHTDLGHRTGQADALWGLADAHQHRGEWDEAIPRYSEALKICTDLGDTQGQAKALWGLATAHRHRGESGKAIPLYSDALKILADLGDRKGQADALCGLAAVHRLRSEYHDALSLYDEALGIFINIGTRQGIAAALLGRAHVYRDQNRWGDALLLHEQAAEFADQIGNMARKPTL